MDKENLWKQAFSLLDEAQQQKPYERLIRTLQLVDLLHKHSSQDQLSLDVWNEGLPLLLHGCMLTALQPAQLPKGQSEDLTERFLHTVRMRLAIATALSGIIQELPASASHIDLAWKVRMLCQGQRL